MNRCNVLVVVVDGLRASALGAYGNTTYATPALDEFAADSFLLDFCFAPAAELRDNYQALWHGTHPLRPTASVENAASLPRHFADNGYRTTLITDDSELRSFAAAQHFDQCVDVAAAVVSQSRQTKADDASQTAFAGLFAATCDVIQSNAQPSHEASSANRAAAPQLIWVHSRGMYGPWDAPIEFQWALLDEGDPPPLETVTPPDIVLSEADDPDAAFRFSCAYAAQVMALDTCWRGLMETVAARPTQKPWLVMLLGARGFPLGEHRRVGGVDPQLYGEQLHVPYLLRFPHNEGKLMRSGALASHVDLLPTIAACTGSAELCAPHHYDGKSILPLLSNADAEWRDALLSTSASSKSLRTATWCLRREDAVTRTDEKTDGSLSADELFVRPDDHWEANDVAKLCPDVVDTLLRVTADVSLQLRQNEPLAVKVLPATGDGA